MIMRLREEDITRLILACELYKNSTGSEYIWDQYEELIKTLKTYLEQHSAYDD
jgi:myosin-crossreactive antigen